MGGIRGVLRPVVVVGVLGAAGVASAQGAWTATVLTPQNVFFEQRAYATAGGVQVGQVNARAALWRGTTGSYVNLGPSLFPSYAAGTDSLFQVGVVTDTPTGSRAVMWSGSAESMIDLTPPDVSGAALAVQGGQQVGSAGGSAALWTGTASSYVNLTPNRFGTAYAVHSGRQGGRIFTTTNVEQAAIWSGTPESRVDLHPSGFTSSVVYGMDGTQQVGYTVRPGGLTVAARWSGTAESFVNLQPTGVLGSIANAVFNGYQVGMADNQPVIWSGTAQSMEFLPFPAGIPRFRGEASGVWSDATTLYVSGWIEDPTFSNLSKAMLWTRPIPAPGCLAVLALAGVVSARRRR